MCFRALKTAVVALLLAMPAAAQRSLDYRSEQLDCEWLMGEIKRMSEQQLWEVEQPSHLYKVVSFLKGMLDVVGGQDEKEFLAMVPKRHPLTFTYRPVDVMESMRYKGCAAEYGEANGFVRAGTLESGKVYGPKSKLAGWRESSK